MEKRVALLDESGKVFNIIIASSVEEMSVLFNCVAIEITEETGAAHIGYGFSDGKFEQRPLTEEELAITYPPVIQSEESETQGEVVSE
jgi:hypothetical protein